MVMLVPAAFPDGSSARRSRGSSLGSGRDPQHAQHRRLQGFAQFLVSQVGQIGQALRDEEQDAEGEPLGAGGVIAEQQDVGTLGQRYLLAVQLVSLRRRLSSGWAECGYVNCCRVAGLPAGQRVDRVDVDEAVAFPEGPGGLVGAVAG